ncbi:histidine kinase [Kineococcus sp. TRM81007]|uniref:sensor histidine kinase n=1 Tax=Kineococcus sp. TRM81007 TaxID=2925831 RepID=UPI0027E29061|nr:histidine kinase [Kineococcus sp. TRM81007]
MERVDPRGAGGRWRRWWGGKDDVERITLYTRQSFALLLTIGPSLTFGQVGRSGALAQEAAAALAVLAAVVVHAVAVGLVLDRQIAGRPVPGPWWLALAAVTAAAFAATALLPPERGGAIARVVVVGALFGPAAFLGTRRSVLLAVLAGAGLLVLHRDGFAWPQQGLLAGVLLVGAFAFLAVTVQLSMWIVDVVRRLAGAQRDRARLAVAEERLRFARDLHDVVGRDLSAIAVTSDLVAELARRGRPEAVERAEEVRRIAQESLREVREVVRGYRGVDLDAELEGAAALLRSAGVECTVTAEAAGASEAARTAAAWVVREGVTNVVRHAAATRCRIEVRGGGEGPVRVLIENDGAPGAAPGRGSGLVGLAERLRPLGGELSTERHEGTFALRAELPVVSA